MHSFRSDIDNSAILYLALIRKDHTNIFRFTLTITEDIDPDLLQQAVDRVHKRMPMIFAGFRPGFFKYTQVQADMPPQVKPDPGCLITMTREEIAQCAYRVYYRENLIIIEGFHALSDGYGIAASFSTLAAEYLNLRYGLEIPDGYPIMNCDIAPRKRNWRIPTSNMVMQHRCICQAAILSSCPVRKHLMISSMKHTNISL